MADKVDLNDSYMAYRGAVDEDQVLRQFMEETASEPPMPKADAATAPAQTAAAAAQGGGEPAAGQDPERTTLESVGAFIRELPVRTLAGGAVDAVRSTVNAIGDIGDALEQRFPLGGFEITGNGLRRLSPEELKARRAGSTFADDVGLPNLPEPTTGGGKIVKGITQFVTALIPANKILGGLGKTAALTKGLAAGALADFTAFEGDQTRLSDLIQQVPALQNPVNDYLSSKEDDSKLMGRFKNSVEGLGLGVATNLLFDGLRAFKAKRNAAAALEDAAKSEPDKLVEAMGKMSADDLRPPVLEREIAERMGDPSAPLVQRVAKKVAKDTVGKMTDDVNAVVASVGRAERMAGETMDEAMTRLVDPTKVTKTAPDDIAINMARINSPEDIKAAMTELANLDKAGINAARRGEKMSFDTMRELADGVGMTPEELIARRGSKLSVEETVAARRLWVASTEKVTELAKRAAAPEATTQDVFAFRKGMSIHYAIQAEVVAARTEQARALSSWRIEVAGGRERAQAIQTLIDQNGGAELSIEMARRMAQLDSPEAVSLFIRQSQRAKTIDVLQEYFVTGLLTSPKTHIVNATSNSATALWSIPERYMSAAVSQTIGNGDITFREANALAWGQVKGAKDGLKMFWKALKSGEPTGTLKVEIPHTPAISAEGLGLQGGMGRAVDFLGNVQRSGSRLLMATDEFFKAIAYRGEVHAQAFREATAEGLTGNDFAKKVVDLVDNPPEHIRMDAVKFADVQTFTNQLGDAGRKFQQFAAGVPGMRFITPFVRTPVNIMKYAFHRTPIAPFVGHIRQEIAAGGVRRDAALAKVSLGTMTMLAISDAVVSGQITGGGPSDKEIKTARTRQGIPDYGIKVGDTWYKYNRLDPLGLMIGMSADISEIMMHASEEEGEQLVMAGTLAFAKNMTSRTYLEGISSALEVIDDPDRNGPQWLANFAGSFIPMSGLSRNVASAMDPVRSETKTAVGDPDVDRMTDVVSDKVAEFAMRMANEIKSRTPGFSKDLPPKRDLWGRPVDMSSPFGMAFDFLSPVAVSEENADPVDQMIFDNRVDVSMPGRVINNVKLTNEEYSRYTEIAGKAAKERLDQMQRSGAFAQLSDGPDGMKANMIKSVVLSARAEAQARMMAENQNLRERVIERKKDSAQTLIQGGKLRK